MTFMGRKVATKDIDIVLSSERDTKHFISAMQTAGFAYVKKPEIAYDTLGTSAIMEDDSGMRFDIFDRQVCRALELSKNMKSHARPYRSFGKLNVYLMAPEDIFLFKGITEREADLDDMRILIEAGLDWQTIEKECLSQKRSARWAYMLGTKLMELRSKFGIDSPIIRTLMDHADTQLLSYVFGNIITQGKTTFEEISAVISSKYRYSDSWTRKHLRMLVKDGMIGAKREGRKHVYYLKKPLPPA